MADELKMALNQKGKAFDKVSAVVEKANPNPHPNPNSDPIDKVSVEAEKARMSNEEFNRKKEAAEYTQQQQLEERSRRIKELESQVKTEQATSKEHEGEIRRLREAMSKLQDEQARQSRERMTETFEKEGVNRGLKNEVDDLQSLLKLAQDEAKNANKIAADTREHLRKARDEAREHAAEAAEAKIEKIEAKGVAAEEKKFMEAAETSEAKCKYEMEKMRKA